MKKKILNECFRTALRKLPEHPEYRNFPHFSFIIQKNKIVEWATNNSSPPNIGYGYQKEKGFIPKMHSELFALKKAKGLLNKNNYECVNIRLNRKGQTRLSKPCVCCYEILKETGCKHIYFSTSNGWAKLL